MGKADKRQAKLSFSGGEKRGATSVPRSGDVDAEEGSPEMSVRAMFMELKTSLAGIDAKLDHVTERLDRIRARVDDHDARFETLETRTSEIEDARSGDREQIAQMEHLLEVIRNKNEDLEARSRRTNREPRLTVTLRPGSRNADPTEEEKGVSYGQEARDEEEEESGVVGVQAVFARREEGEEETNGELSLRRPREAKPETPPRFWRSVAWSGPTYLLPRLVADPESYASPAAPAVVRSSVCQASLQHLQPATTYGHFDELNTQLLLSPHSTTASLSPVLPLCP
ncbi:hypothetical protein NDU88_006426 [Pleurodeles waltl]|uniref:Uncharacterized protein n=1 Tax=Pleurodeles waltl TaxID=8319 RepID=A0AAV7QLQ6_PLEWA|nr:hypothetical protein NDU88_006426 [Pleurodeles waltl]